MNRDFCALALGLLLIFSSIYSHADGEVRKPDVRLVIDVSGSMKKNDPNNLRQPAVDLLVRLLPDGSKAGVWTFGKYVNMLIPHKEVSPAWRDMARSKAKEINSVGLFTNIGGALEKAAHDSRRPSDKFKTSVILLTDGMVDISKSPDDNQKEWRRIVDKVLPELKGAEFTIHTVALSENADTNLLEKIAVSTDGTSAVAYNAEDLMKIFLKAFDVAAPSQQVPLEGNTFAVDSSVEEFTALIFRIDSAEQTQLLGPDEKIYSSKTKDEDLNWLRTEQYDLITVSRPVEGEWTVKANIDPESRITIVSDMKLRVKTLPNNTFKGAQENLNFVLQEDGKTITRPDFLSLLTNTVTIAHGPKDTPTAQIWTYEFPREVMPNNGVFKVELPSLKRMGIYEVAVVVDGKTFKRSYSHRISVREPFTADLALELDDSGIEQYILTVKSHSDNIDVKKTQVVATVTNPNRRRMIKPLGFTQFDHWQTVLHPDLKGEYRITVQVTGEDAEGEPFEYTLSPLKLNYDPDSAFEEPVVEQEVEELAAEVTPEATSSKVEESPATEKPTEPIEVVAPEEPVAEVPENSLQSLPKWMIYLGLGLGNLLILGGGYFLIRKLISSGADDALDGLDDEIVPEPPLATLESTEPASEPEPPMADDDDSADSESFAMDGGDGGDDELPPMEDIDDPVNKGGIEDDSPDNAIDRLADDKPLNEPPVIDDVLDDDDFGVDDLEDDSAIDLSADEEIDDLEEEMRKVEGLDLAEDELDDAINNLIDELDDDEDEDGGKSGS